MQCPMCEAEVDNIFMKEEFDCCECNKKNVVTYHICTNCRHLWREINGTVVDNSVVGMNDLLATFEPSSETKKMFDNLSADIEKIQRVQSGEARMSDFVHRCLRCNELALPCKDNTFKCTSCSFEWEVLKVE
jgi:hypothetical protein